MGASPRRDPDPEVLPLPALPSALWARDCGSLALPSCQTRRNCCRVTVPTTSQPGPSASLGRPPRLDYPGRLSVGILTLHLCGHNKPEASKNHDRRPSWL